MVWLRCRAWYRELDPLTALGIATASMCGCQAERQLGEIDDTTETAGSPETDTAAGSDTMSTAASADGTDTTGTEDDDVTCAEWSPPPLDCEAPASASFQVSLEADGPQWLPELDSEACTVESVQSISANTDRVTLVCDETHVIEITTSEPQLELPIAAGQDVLFSSVTEAFSYALDGVGSFVIRSTEGALLMSRINELDLTPDLSVDPVVFTPIPSGCEPFDGGAAICDQEGHVILLQRIAVEFGNGIAPITVFPGHHAVVQAGDGEADVIVNRATQYACWDETCAGDDAGPFQRLDLLISVRPPR
jgi:hypothetical protein